MKTKDFGRKRKKTNKKKNENNEAGTEEGTKRREEKLTTATWTVKTRRKKKKKRQVQQQKQQHAEEEKKEGSEPIKNQARQIIRGRRSTTDSWLERIDGCCIPDVKWQCVPNRRPKRENVLSPPALPLQDGSGRRRVPTLKWRDREGEHSCRRSERQTGVGEVNSVETEPFERRRASSGAVRV